MTRDNKIFVTSDTHWDHSNILKYCPNRKFPNVGAMNKGLIKAWNRKVGLDDVIYHLGDLTLGGIRTAGDILCQLNGHVRMLTYPSHHDKRWLPRGRGQDVAYKTKSSWVEFLGQIVTLEVGRLEVLRGRAPTIILCHFPIGTWENRHHGSWHLFGHTHQENMYSVYHRGWSLNVGIDACNGAPANLEDLAQVMLNHGYGESQEWIDD